MTAQPMRPEDVPAEWAEAGAAALRAAAYECDGDCGLSEQECYRAHPVNWSGMVAGETHITGDVPEVSRIVLAAVIPAIRAQAIADYRAEIKQLHDRLASPGGRHPDSNVRDIQLKTLAVVLNHIARGDQ